MSSRHRQQELAQVLGRALVLGLHLDLGELGDAVDQPGDRRGRTCCSISSSVASVSSIVSCSSAVTIGLAVELEVGQDAGDFDRMA